MAKQLGQYNLTEKPVENEIARAETFYRLSGGYTLDETFEGYLEPFAPLYIDFALRKAKAVKNVVVAENIATDGTTLKIKKGSLAYVGMHLGNGTKGATVSAIDKSNADYDALTVTAFGAAITKDTILFEASAVGGTAQKYKANTMNYARTKVESGASITALGQAYEIIKSKCPYPIHAKDIENLGSRFMFI